MFEAPASGAAGEPQYPPPPPAAGTDQGTPVPPVSTAAATIAVDPEIFPFPEQPAPVYLPDNGGKLSGLEKGSNHAGEIPAGPVQTLREALILAYRTNPQLLAARAQARSADFGVPQARSAYGPTLSARGAYTFTRTRVERLAGPWGGAKGWASDASLVLTQPVWTFGRNAASEAGAVATSEYQRASLRVTEAQILRNVVAAYVSVLRDAASVRIAQQNLALLKQQLDVVETRFKVRDLTLTDLDQTRTRLQVGQAQLLLAQGKLGISQMQFLQYVGAPPGELEVPEVLNIQFRSLEDAYAFAEMHSPLVRAAQAREKISRASVAAARAELGPRVDLRGTFNYGSISPYSDQLRTTQATGQVVLTQSLFDSGLRDARINGARETNEADWRLLDSVYRDTREAIGGAWDDLASSRASLVNYQSAITAAQSAYDGALIQQQTGDRSVLDVLDLARDLLTVRNNYNYALASEYSARANLLQAAGMLEADKVLPDLRAYDADRHYDKVRHRGDIPLLTPILSGLDGITTGNLSANRPTRDAGAQKALD
ncbi:MAG: TolC family protein, partial [Novosphingobium sp.]